MTNKFSWVFHVIVCREVFPAYTFLYIESLEKWFIFHSSIQKLRNLRMKCVDISSVFKDKTVQLS